LPNYYSLLLKVDDGQCYKFIEYLGKHGIPSEIKRYDYKVLYKYPLFYRLKRDCKNAERIANSFTTIPVHPGLKKTELDYIVKIINNYKVNADENR
jgi:Predicted pyridoxal phosphate-dependent enzyme apparently involved in regulation of cell wall biogenesis